MNAPGSPVETFKSVFNRLTRANLEILDELYAPTIVFRDPLHQIQGLTVPFGATMPERDLGPSSFPRKYRVRKIPCERPFASTPIDGGLLPKMRDGFGDGMEVALALAWTERPAHHVE